MANQRKWGDWSQEGKILTLASGSHPRATIDLSQCITKKRSEFDSKLGELENKFSLSKIELQNLEAARQDLCDENLVEETGAPHSPLPKDEYISDLEKAWPKFLNASTQSDESVFQEYFERNPCLLPSPWHSPLQVGHHGVMDRLVISQPELPAPDR